MKTISIELLKSLYVSPAQIALFERAFGESVEITQDNCLKAIEAGLDLDWIARNVLSETAYSAYKKAKKPARRAYKRAKRAAWAGFKEAETAAWDAYCTSTADTWDAFQGGEIFERECRERNDKAGRIYESARAAALDACRKAKASELASYNKARAIAFYTAWREDNEGVDSPIVKA